MRPIPQDPTACPAGNPPRSAFHARRQYLRDVLDVGRIVSVPPMSNHLGTLVREVALDRRCETDGQVLLRKEVIQPHLPVRLPCYDFVPIADPTFDGSLPCGLGHRLRVLPTFVT